jgi:hypothetical protein
MTDIDLEYIEDMIEKVPPEGLALAIQVFGDMREAHLDVSESVRLVMDAINVGRDIKKD